MPKGPPVVAIVNTNPDLVRILRVALERAGFIVFELYVEPIKLGQSDVDALLEHHDPRVIIYDVAPPYDQNWRFLDHLRAAPRFRGRQFVLTTTNVQRVREIVGTDDAIYEVVGGDADIAEIVRVVREAAKARPTR